MTPSGEREYSEQALGECDGSSGKATLVAVDGIVYDASGSRMWKGGLHMKRHRAGHDLSTDLAAAPHGREVLERIPRVGTLKKEEADGRSMPAWLAELLERVPFLRRHLHPMVVHFPIVFMYSATFFDILFLMTGERSFERTAFYCLTGGVLFTPPAMLTGWFTWWLNYAAKPMRAVTIKKRVSWLLLAIATAAFLWRCFVPDVMEATGLGHALYALLILLLVPIVSIVGYFGGELTFPTGKK
ncbi:MAG TPA: DUF2231 domain-containing protein [Syntrophales bacterium]|nr:DUF2231 domain-containing protein [Syntrophales bacterium]